MTGFADNRRSAHRCHVVIYRHDGDPIDLVTDVARGPDAGGPVALIGATSSKTMGPGAGTFTLSLKRGTLNIQREIRVGDWVVLYWSRNGVPLYGTMGPIRSVQRSRSVTGSRASTEAWTVSAQDIGRIFALTKVWFDDYTGFQSNIGGKILGGRMGFNPSGAPDQIVQRIIDAFLGSDGIVGGAWLLPKGLGYLGEHFTQGLYAVAGMTPALPLAPPPTGRLGTDGVLRGFAADELSLFQPTPGQPLTSILNEWSNPLLNELYFDISDDPSISTPDKPRPIVVVRERPFVNADDGKQSPWFKMPTVYLPHDAIVSSDVATDDDERLNLFMLYATGTGLANFDQYIAYPPSYARTEAARHGLRIWEQASKFANDGGRGDGLGWMEEIAKWHSLVTSWYAPNHLWLNGSLKVPYIVGEARIGKRLVIGDSADVNREQFYIEGVTIDWRYPRLPSTTFNVTRGWIGSDNDLVDAVKTLKDDVYRRPVNLLTLKDAGTALV